MSNKYPGGIITANPNQFDPMLGSAAPGVWTIDQAADYQSNRQWPIYDPYFNQTTLLLHGENPVSQTDSTWLKDASANNLDLTAVGDVKASSQTPFADNWSWGFNGPSGVSFPSDTYLPSSGSSGIFTIEMWIFINNYPLSGLVRIFDYSSTSIYATGDPGLQYDSNGYGGQPYPGNDGYIPTRTWTHIALVKDGQYLEFYINGVLWSSQYMPSPTNTTGPDTADIGFKGVTDSFDGFISNLRVVNGTAVYTNNFTPPTRELTATQSANVNGNPSSAITSGTTLLACQDNRFFDSSGNTSHISTVTGAPSTQYITPFNNNTFNGGSAYFDGTGDYLSTTPSAIQPGTGNFTFECWLYPIGTQASDAGIFSTGTSGGLQLSYYLTTGLGIASSGVGSLINSTVLPAAGAWNHVVFCRGGTGTNQASIYLNGRRVANGTVATNFANGTMNLGYQGSGTTALFNGYMSQARYVNSDVYGYTNTSITVPTSPLAPISGTQLLTFQSPTATQNKSFRDSSYNNLPITTIGNTSQGSFSPFSMSGWSTYFNGTSSVVYCSGESHFAYGTNNFCIEMWIYPNSSGIGELWDQRPTSTNGAYATIIQQADNTIAYYAQSSTRITSDSAVPLNQWTHIAVERVSSVTTLYINGVAQSQTYADTNSYLNGANRPMIGRNGFAVQNYYDGFITGVRVTSSPSSFVYNGNFVPNTKQFTSTNNTQFLAFQTNNYETDEGPNTTNFQFLGSPKTVPFSPYFATYTIPSTYSYVFNGATSNLFCSANASPLGNEPFTYEGFIYARSITSNSTTTMRIFDSSNIAMAVYNTGEIIATPRAGTIVGSNLVLNTWTHVAVVKNTANVVTLYINGNVSGTSLTDTNYYQQANVVIGGANAAPTNRTFNGLISNFRLVKGSAVYTANFKPPSSPLTRITNTSLLTCQSSSIIDNSINNFPLFERGGVTLTDTHTPFSPLLDQTTSSVYSTSLVGGSAYFDGTGDYLTTSNIAAPSNNVAFTAEAWYYPTDLASATARIIDANAFSIGVTTGGAVYGEVKNTTHTVSVTGPTINLNTWNHVALVRTGNAFNNANVFLYHNGLRVGARPNERGNVFPGGNVTIGGVSGGAAATLFIGYITGARVLQNTALYTSNFIPAPAVPSVVSNTSLLMNFSDPGIVDSSGRNVLESISNVRTSSAVTKFGSRSLFFDGNTGYLDGTPSVTNAFGTGDFTVEMWVYPTINSNSYIFSCLQNSATGTGFHAQLTNATGALRLYSSGAYRLTTSQAAASVNTWNHIAIARSNNTVRVYVNGVRDPNTWTLTTESFTDGVLYIGNSPSGPTANIFRGYMDEVRITKGINRYTGNFTPQTSAWQNQ